MNNEKYGTAAYDIREAINDLEKSLEKVKKLQISNGQIKPVVYCNFFSSQYFEVSRHFKETTFSRFDENNITHITQCVENAKKYCEDQKIKLEEAHKNNLENIESNKILVENIKNFMNMIGIPDSYTTYEYPTPRAKTRKSVNHYAGYLSDISRCIPTNDGYDKEIILYNDRLKQITEWETNKIEKIKAAQKKKEQEDEYIRKVAKAMELADKHGLDKSKYPSNEELFAAVDEIERKIYIEENYPDGDTITQKSCYDCNSWTIGERRCSCGNRRIDLTVEGDFMKGFYAYPEAY